MNNILKFFSDNASAITAIATIVIAIFTSCTWWISRRIHQSSQQRDKEMNAMYLNLVSAIMSSSGVPGNPIDGAKAFKAQRKELSKLFNEEESE